MAYVPSAVATCDVSTGGAMSFVAPTGMTLAEVCVPTTCTPPETPANAIGFSKTGESVEAVWSLNCDTGYVVDVAGGVVDTRCLKTSLLTQPAPKCIEAAGCNGAEFDTSTVDNTGGSGTCVADMKDGDECQLQCAEGFQAVGQFLCNNGKLDGILTCLSAALAASAVEVALLSSAFALTIDLGGMDEASILALFTTVTAKTLGVSENDMAKVDIGSSRRLAAQRRLQAGYEVAYQAVIPEGTDPAAIAAKASGIGSGGASQDALVGAFAAAGKTVDPNSLKVTQAPKTFTATIVRGEGGKPLAPAPPAIPTVAPVVPTPTPTPPPTTPTGPPTPSPTTSTATEDEGGSNVGAIVGGVVGGLVALLLIGGAAYYFLVVKKKQTE